MKTIIFNGRFLSQSTTGVQRYAFELIKKIDELIGNKWNDKIDFVILAPKDIKHEPKLKHIKLKKVGRTTGHIWEQIELPFYSKGSLLVNLCNTSPVIKKRQTVTIHDAAVFATNQYTRLFTSWYRFLYKSVSIKKNQVITVSNFSKQELMNYCKIKEDKIQVIYEGMEHILEMDADDSIIDKHKLKKTEYVLAVSSMSPNKNFATIVKAIEQLGEIDYPIVVCGGANPQIFSTSDIQSNSKIKYLGYVNDAELKALYRNAGCFVYPSFYEGFGLPPLEAIACGCPVLVSNTASLPEIFSDAALYCNPSSVDDVAEKISLIMNNQGIQDKLRKNGFLHSQKFNWEDSAMKSLDVYKKLLKTS